MKKVLFFLFFTILACYSQNYIYPVGAADEHTIYFVYQKGCDHLELWSLDLESQEVTKQLPAMYTPAGFCLLPDSQSFSFVDNGRIRVKSLCKRSPKSVELDRPLYDISLVHWINNRQAYLSAKYHNHFGIFKINTEGDVEFLLHDHTHDYLYPQKVDNDIFFIKRTKNNSEKLEYTIGKTHFSKPEAIEVLLDFQHKPIAYLHMMGPTHGFFVQHPAGERYDQDCLPMTCYHFYKANNTWRAEKLFDFSIPTALLFMQNCSRLYESLLPLLPTYKNNKIYFTSWNDGLTHLYEYNLSQKTKSCIAKSPNTHILKPLIAGELLICGGNACKDNSIIPKTSEPDRIFWLHTIVKHM